MTARADDPRLLTAKQLADIAICRVADYPVDHLLRLDHLLRHIDAQTELIAELAVNAGQLHAWLTGDREFFDTDTIDAMRSIVELLDPTAPEESSR